MKYVIVIPDGCADEPVPQLGGKTPLQAAQIPAMDRIAQLGIVGRANNVPLHLTAGSAVANMSLLGYDPNEHFSGRAPLEAAAQGIELGPKDWAIRCNLVTIADQNMKDFTADHISSQEAQALLADLQTAIAGSSLGNLAALSKQLELVAGVSYRNLLLFREGAVEAPFSMETFGRPPHDLTDKTVINDFPSGPGCRLLLDLMELSVEVFTDHPVNQKRIADGKLPATNVWLWGLGKTPTLAPFQQVYGLEGKMITAVDLLRGLAKLIGWENIEVPGATGYTDTDYAAKGQYAIDALSKTDIICVHVEATDEASHEGDVLAKVKALEEIDSKIVAPLFEAVQKYEDFRFLISPDHPTPVRTKTHSHGFVPLTICGKGIEADSAQTYDDVTAGDSSTSFEKGFEMMKQFIG